MSNSPEQFNNNYLKNKEQEKDKKSIKSIFNTQNLHPIFLLLIGIVILAGSFFFISVLAGEIALLIAGWIIVYIIYVFESKIKITDLFIHINEYKSLFFFTIIMSGLIIYKSGIIGGLLFFILIWGYSNKNNTKLINRLKNFKQYKIRFSLSILIILISIVMMFLHFKEAKQQAFPEPTITITSSQEKQDANKQYKLEFSVKDYIEVKVNGKQVNPQNNLFSKSINLDTIQTRITIDAKNEHKDASITIFITRDETNEEKQKRLEIEKAREEQAAKIRVENKTKQSATTESSPKPRLLGKWFGKRNVYLANEGSKYVATFDPPLPKSSLIIPTTSSDPIYPYLVSLLNEVWGLLPSQLSNPQIASPLIFYENYASGEKFSFLVFKDETTGAVFGVSFWKE